MDERALNLNVIRNLQKHASFAFVLFTFALSGCENPFSKKTEVTDDFHPGVAMDLAKSVVEVSNTSVAAGAAISVKVKVLDQNGQAFKPKGKTVTLGFDGGTSTGQFSAVTDNGDGTFTSQFSGQRAGTAVRILAYVDGAPFTGTLPSVTVTTGALSLSNSSVSVSSATVVAGSNVTLTLTAKDVEGNLLSSGGLTVAFSRSGGVSSGTISSVTDNANGTYSATFSATTAGSATNISATIGGSAVTSTAPTITVSAGALSLSQTTVGVSSSTVPSGSNVVVTLTAKDSFGNVKGGGLTVAFARSGGVSNGTFSSVTDNSNGTYTANFTGTTAGSATTITATVDGSAVTSTLPTVAVNTGPISTSQSLVTVSSSTVSSGSSVTITLTAKDAGGNAITSGGSTIAFSRSGGTSNGTIGSVTDVGNGTYTASFTGTTSGTATTINATIGGSAVTSSLPTVTVNPGAINRTTSVVTVSSSTVSSGSSITISLTAKDAAGNLLTTGGASVAFSRSGGISNGNIGSVTDVGNGTYTASFTGTTSGSATTINATIGGSAVTTSLPTVTVNPGSVSTSQSLVSVSSSSVASGSSVTVTLTAKDAAGNQLTSGGLTVAFSRSGGTGSGTFGSVTDVGNGTYTASFTGTTSGTATTINATIGGSAVSSSLPTVTVNPGAASLSQSLVTVSSGTVVAGSNVTVTLTVKDAQGNQHTSGGLAVVFSNSGGVSSGTFGTVTDAGNGTYTASFTGTTSGSATTISATIGGSAVTSTLPTVTVSTGPISTAQSVVSVSSATVVSGSSITLTLTAKDAGGNSLTTGGSTVVFSHTGGVSTGTIGSTTNVGNGTYTATFTGVVAGSATTITATIGGSAVTSTLPTVTVTPGTISTSQSLVTVAASTVKYTSSTTLTLTAKDSNGNSLTSGGSTVVFTRSGGTSTGTIGSTTDNGNGTYTATFTAGTIGTATTINATIGGAAVTSSLPTITVVGVNLEVPIEMLDYGAASNTSLISFERSQTTLDTADYDGTVTYYFEIVASNSNASTNYAVSLINATPTVITSLNVPANTTNPTRIRGSFTPNAGAAVYRVQTPATASASQLRVYSARILVKQVNATKTRLYFPLVGEPYNTTSNNDTNTATVLSTSSTTYTQGTGTQPVQFQIWQKNSTAYANVASGSPWRFDAVLSTSNSTSRCYATLYNMDGNQVTSSEIYSIATAAPELVSGSFADNAANFTNGGEFHVMIKSQSSSRTCYIAKAGLWLKLDTLVKGESHYRVERVYDSLNASAVTPNGRVLLDTSLFNNSTINVYYETSGYVSSTGAGLTLRVVNHGTADTGTSSTSAVTGCSLVASGMSTTRARYRSGACSGITNGDRYINELVRTSGTIYTSPHFVIISFQ